MSTGSSRCFDVSGDLRVLALGRRDGVALFTHARGIGQLGSDPEPQILDLKGDTISCVGLSADGSTLATLQYDSVRQYGWVHIWNTKDLAMVGAIPEIPIAVPTSANASRLAFSPTGNRLFVPVGTKVLIYDVPLASAAGDRLGEESPAN